MSAFIIAILSGVFTIVGSVAGALTTYLLGNRNAAAYKNSIIKHARQVTSILAKLRRETKAMRALLVKVENGKIRNLDTVKFVTVVDESFEDPAVSSVERFQKYRADKAYMNLIKIILENQIYQLKIDEMEEGFLKHFYLSQQVNNSIIFPVFECERKLYFVSISFNEEKSLHDPSIRVAIDQVQHHLEALIREFPEAVS